MDRDIGWFSYTQEKNLGRTTGRTTQLTGLLWLIFFARPMSAFGIFSEVSDFHPLLITRRDLARV